MINGIKVLIVAPHFYPKVSGYSNAATNLVKSLDESIDGIKVDVLTNEALTGDKSELSLKNGEVHRIKFGNILHFYFRMLLFEIKAFFKILKLDKVNNYDFIMFETVERAILLYFLSKTKIHKKIGFRIHSVTETEYFIWGRKLEQKVRRKLVIKALGKIKYILSTTDFYIDFFKRYFFKENILKISEKVFYKVENVVPANPVEEGEETLKKYNLNEGEYFFTLGRLSPDGIQQKGFFDLILATYMLKKDNPQLPNSFKIVLVGDGEKYDYLKGLVKELGLTEHYQFIKRMDNKEIHYLQKKSRAVILFSRYEGMSMFALEALANGAALLFTRVGGLTELLMHEENGYFVEPQNINDMKDKIHLMFNKNSDEIKRMKNRSLEIYEKRLLPDKIAFRFNEFLEFVQKI